jgi:hypothetical protein
MLDHYVLIGQTPVECELLEWAEAFETMDRHMAKSSLFDLCVVSTVFLGLDHSFGDGPPLLFETMLFWEDEGGNEQTRCSTWLEAEEQHARMVKYAGSPTAVLAYCKRMLSSWWDDACRSWREA